MSEFIKNYDAMSMIQYLVKRLRLVVIEYEIKKSKSVIVDLTDCNNGAYFEAGIARGLGKKIIFVCNEKEKNEHEKRVHFDVKQMNIIEKTL